MRVRLLVSFAGDLAGNDSPAAGRIIDVDEALGIALCSNGRAERVEPETSMAAGAPERAVKPRGKARG